MTVQKPLFNSPSEVVKTRKKYLISRQKNTVDINELAHLRRELTEVDYLIGKYKEPTTRRRMERQAA